MAKRMGGLSAGLFVLVFASSVMAASPAAPVPEYWPLCPSPQNIAPVSPAGGTLVGGASPVVWNGQDYAVAWVDSADNLLHFRRFFADGTPEGPIVTPSAIAALSGYAPSLVWNGSGYAVAFDGLDTATSYYQIYFALLNPDGSLLGTEVKASSVGQTETYHSLTPKLAWSGSQYAVTWYDPRTGPFQVYATLLDPSGAVANAGASHDIPVSSTAYDEHDQSVVWSTGAGAFVLAWRDYRSGTSYQIYTDYLTPTAILGTAAGVIIDSALSIEPTLADSGNGLGLAWLDGRDGNDEIYFAGLDSHGYSKTSAETRLTNDPHDSSWPCIVWTGAEFGVFWQDNRTGHYDLWFQRVSAAGSPAGGNVQVTTSSGTLAPAAAFAHYDYVATGTASIAPNYVVPWGCNADSTPPTCPGGFVAYNITGSGLTIGWLPSGEDYTDIAYYVVYRNAVPIARTSNTYYVDSGLNLSTTYAYAVEPVNAAQLQNTTCQSTFYVKTNATLVLTLNKSDPNAVLTWTDTSGQTVPSYNVFRGTSPQVMQQVGTGTSTYTDPDALTNTVLYFYTVDEPGW